MNSLQHWNCDVDQSGVCWALMDRANASANTINTEVLNELELIVEEMMREKKYTGLVIGSAKAKGFVAGADINQFREFTSVEEGFNLLRHGQTVFQKLEDLTIPTVAMINGFCMGGGFELALSCDYRIALRSPKTKIGLPEVMLGIHPGWGGSVRLPKLIGAPKALAAILSGKAYKARQAKRLGFVDDVVPERYMKKAALSYLKKQPKRNVSLSTKLTNSGLMRPILAKMVRGKLQRKVRKDHYPAPFAALDVWRKNGIGPKAMLTEAHSVANLFATPTCKNLVRDYFLRETLKGLAKGGDFKAKHVHVIGAGTMGGDIAAWCAVRGLRVTLQDQKPEQIAPAVKRANKLFKKVCSVKRDQKMFADRLIPDVNGHGVESADVIIEAIYENLQAKQELFAMLEKKAKSSAILATNTSSIPLDEIAESLQNPSRLVGIHFFNPVAKMPLVEVVHGEQTSDEIKHAAISFVGQISKLPLPVLSRPGFLVNRVLMPYLMQAVQLQKEGVPINVIDKIALDFGMPMGPVALADTVGLDICLSVAKNLATHYGYEVPKDLERMVEEGKLGVKSGEGFYQYDKHGKKKTPKTPHHTKAYPDVADRLILVMLNEAVKCLSEGVVEDTDQLDAGMIFGTGFAPFTGGPIHYARTRGVEEIAMRLRHFSQTVSPVFEPDVYWSKL